MYIFTGDNQLRPCLIIFHGGSRFCLPRLVQYLPYKLTLQLCIAAITPGHSHSPQSGESPADLVISKNWVVPGQLLELELKTKDNSTFKGFIIQARNLKLKDQQVC